jgi:hypothetical protein
LQAFEGILARMSCSEGSFYKQSFHWTLDSATVTVALIKTADFLLLTDVVSEVLMHGSSCFRQSDDLSPLEELSHPGVEALIRQVRGGSVANGMTTATIKEMYQFNFSAVSPAASSATLKVVLQWLRRADLHLHCTASDIHQLFHTVCTQVVKHNSEHAISLAKELANHIELDFNKAVDQLPRDFFEHSTPAMWTPGTESLANTLIQTAVQHSHLSGKFVSKIFPDNDYTRHFNRFEAIRERYLRYFELCLSDRPLSPDEFGRLLDHIAGGHFKAIIGDSTTFPVALQKMNQAHHDQVVNIISKGRYALLSENILMSLSPGSRSKLVAIIMPKLASLDTAVQKWIDEALGRGDL